jgi:hypothetical protein
MGELHLLVPCSQFSKQSQWIICPMFGWESPILYVGELSEERCKFGLILGNRKVSDLFCLIILWWICSRHCGTATGGPWTAWVAVTLVPQQDDVAVETAIALCPPAWRNAIQHMRRWRQSTVVVLRNSRRPFSMESVCWVMMTWYVTWQ